MTDSKPTPVFVKDPANPTDAELAAAIERGLADGSLIDASEWLARNREAEPGPEQTGIQAILDDIKRASFVDGYQATDAEAFGLLLARHFQWDGIEIMKAAAAGLEDANFHTEAGQLSEMAEQAERA
jgi:hypothetical protein